MRPRSACSLFALLLFSSSLALAQDSEVELLKTFDPSKDTIQGNWKKVDDELRIEPGRGSRCFLAREVGESYQLTAEFTRQSGDDVVAVILPVGGVSVALEFSSWQGEAHGIARVDGQTSKSEDNPTSVRPGTLENNQRYRVDVDVSQSKDQPVIKVQLDGKELITWTGASSRLQPHLAFNLPEPNAIGLAAGNSEVVFHTIRLRQTKAPAKPKSAPPRSAKSEKLIDLSPLAAAKTPGWKPFNDARFTTSTEGEVEVLKSAPEVGSGDRGAYLSDVEFTDGVIELDLKGADQRGQSFLGVVFHGVDGDTYDAVYFRPFNFKAANEVNRSHAVQYISHPEWPWERLRSERTGEFEQAVNPAPNADDWFHARIEVDGARVRVFVNDNLKPCLDIEKISRRSEGKVGLWFNGIASFANLSVTPANNNARRDDSR